MDGSTSGSNKTEELLRLEFPGDSQYLGAARRALAEVIAHLNMDPRTEADLMLAFGEAVSNAILYGSHAEYGNLDIRCRLAVHSDMRALVIDVKNPGNGFHPERTPQKFTMPLAEDYSEHGRGLPLMRLLTDSVEIFSDNGDTVVRLSKNLS